MASDLSKFYGPAIKEVNKPIGRVSAAYKTEKAGVSLLDTRNGVS